MKAFKNCEENKEEIKAGALSLIVQHAISIDATRDMILAIIKNINICIICIVTMYFSLNQSLLFDKDIKTGILRILLMIIIDFTLNAIMKANITLYATRSKATMCARIVMYCNLKSLLTAEEFESFESEVSRIALNKTDND